MSVWLELSRIEELTTETMHIRHRLAKNPLLRGKTTMEGQLIHGMGNIQCSLLEVVNE